MNNNGLHPMKKLEMVIRGDRLAFLENALAQTGVSGYTIIRDVSGRGHHGFHGGRLVFNDKDSHVLILAVAPWEKVQQVIQCMKPLLEEDSGVMFISDTEVLRADYFLPSNTSQ